MRQGQGPSAQVGSYKSWAAHKLSRVQFIPERRGYHGTRATNISARHLISRRLLRVHPPVLVAVKPRRAAPRAAVQVVLHHSGEELCLLLVRLPPTKRALRVAESQHTRVAVHGELALHHHIGRSFRQPRTLRGRKARVVAADGHIDHAILDRGSGAGVGEERVRAQRQRLGEGAVELVRLHTKTRRLGGHQLQLVRVGDKVLAALEGELHRRRRTVVHARGDNVDVLGAVAQAVEVRQHERAVEHARDRERITQRVHLSPHQLDVGLQPARAFEGLAAYDVAYPGPHPAVGGVLAAARPRRRALDVHSLPRCARSRVGRRHRRREGEVPAFSVVGLGQQPPQPSLEEAEPLASVTVLKACGRQRHNAKAAARADDAAVVGVRLNGEHAAQQQPVEDTLVVREGIGERQSAQRPLARELDRAGVRPEPNHACQVKAASAWPLARAEEAVRAGSTRAGDGCWRRLLATAHWGAQEQPAALEPPGEPHAAQVRGVAEADGVASDTAAPPVLKTTSEATSLPGL
eukprot:scaffold7257_cov65-Phaeocystis_antarctica.AAC.13